MPKVERARERAVVKAAMKVYARKDYHEQHTEKGIEWPSCVFCAFLRACARLAASRRKGKR